MNKKWLLAGSAFCFFSVLFGAFGAHALKDHLSEYAKGIYALATNYMFTHGLAILVVSGVGKVFEISVQRSLQWFAFGTIVFSGSLLALAITGKTWLGAITPIGGVSLLIGWSVFMVRTFKSSSSG